MVSTRSTACGFVIGDHNSFKSYFLLSAMYNKLTQLSFVIGLFFTIVSVILIGNMLVKNEFTALNLYTSITFLVFGIGMMFIKKRKEV